MIATLLGAAIPTSSLAWDSAVDTPPLVSDPEWVPMYIDFAYTWMRTDQPVMHGGVDRTWMWGPGSFTHRFREPYDDAPGGERLVQYFDKSRMEIRSDRSYSPNEPWNITNGLLALELITGRLQLGDNRFEQRQSSTAQVAGDQHPASPTYAMLQPLLDEPATEVGQNLHRRLNSDGSITSDPNLQIYSIWAMHHEPLRNHTVASVFWDFMNAEGVIWEDHDYRSGRLFRDPFYAVGLPITEAYWVNVPVRGEWQDVLVQCFERRCLTYTPANPQGWQVEAGNVGRHYYLWRYGDAVIPRSESNGHMQE